MGIKDGQQAVVGTPGPQPLALSVPHTLLLHLPVHPCRCVGTPAVHMHQRQSTHLSHHIALGARQLERNLVGHDAAIAGGDVGKGA